MSTGDICRQCVASDLEEAKDLADATLSSEELDLTMTIPGERDAYLRLLLGLTELIQRERHHIERLEEESGR